jgi:hypothetical protein
LFTCRNTDPLPPVLVAWKFTVTLAVAPTASELGAPVATTHDPAVSPAPLQLALYVSGAGTYPVLLRVTTVLPELPGRRSRVVAGPVTDTCGAGTGALTDRDAEPKEFCGASELFTVSVTVPSPPAFAAWNDRVAVVDPPTASVADVGLTLHGDAISPAPLQLGTKLTDAGTLPEFEMVNAVVAAWPEPTDCTPVGALTVTCGACTFAV